jgi:16S rRNA (guanine966-N2)-methyltransferase
MENLNHTKLFDRAKVLTADVTAGLISTLNEMGKFDIIFLDPPYNKNLIQETLNFVIKSDIIKKNGIIVAERDVDDVLPEEVGNFKLIRNQKYGDTILSFYAFGEGNGL